MPPDRRPPGAAAGGRRTAVRALALDVASIVVFAALGRRAHGGTGGLGATLEVAAPFVVGWLVAALAVGVHRRPAAVAPALRALALGLPLGLALRAATGGGVAPAFVAVAVVVNAATLVGRRVLAGRGGSPSGRTGGAAAARDTTAGAGLTSGGTAIDGRRAVPGAALRRGRRRRSRGT